MQITAAVRGKTMRDRDLEVRSLRSLVSDHGRYPFDGKMAVLEGASSVPSIVGAALFRITGSNIACTGSMHVLAEQLHGLSTGP